MGLLKSVAAPETCGVVTDAGGQRNDIAGLMKAGPDVDHKVPPPWGSQHDHWLPATSHIPPQQYRDPIFR